jgi:hypothetical protein
MKILVNVLAVVLGLVLGSIVNMGLILAGGQLVPPPAGADTTTMEGLKAALPLFEAKHFLFPFLAHALGTLAGAAVAAFVARSGRFACAMVVGCFFLLGGAINVAMLPAPMWFNVTDLLLAYLPMAWLGHRLGAGKNR